MRLGSIYADVSPKGLMCQGLRYAICQMHTASHKLEVETESYADISPKKVGCVRLVRQTESLIFACAKPTMRFKCFGF